MTKKDIVPIKLEVVFDDITEQDCDAIVNAANKELQRGGGVCGAIFEKANLPELQQECNRLAPIKTGEAVITKGYNLKASFIIHAVGPQYRDSSSAPLLRNAYLNSLKLAEEYMLKSMAFPSISTGIYGYPVEDAARIAIKAIKEFNNRNLENVKIVCNNEKTFNAYQKALDEYENIGDYKNELITLLKDVFQNTSIYLPVRFGDKGKLMPALKYTIEGGYIIFVNKTRHLNVVAKQIPNYDKATTIEILEELAKEGKIILCEADKEKNNYTYTITLLDERFINQEVNTYND